MKIIAFGIALLVAPLCTAVGQPNSLILLFVNATSRDAVGARIIYDLKQDIVRSSQYHLVYDESSAAFTINLVTIDENLQQPGNSSAYAEALTISRTATLLGQWVGTCGIERTQDCAAEILADIPGTIDELRTKH